MKLICLVIFYFISLVSSERRPLLVVSFDGLRADKFDNFIQQNPHSSFAKFIRTGVKAEYMQPSFPSATYPNYMSLVTGRFLLID